MKKSLVCVVFYLYIYMYVSGKTRNPAVREVLKRFQTHCEVPKIFQADREVPI